MVDTSKDATPTRSAEHPFSSNNLRYDKWVVVVKITLLFFTVFLGNVQGGVVASWAVLFGGIVLFCAGLRYPPYYHQRGRRWVDPNSFQTGLDAGMVWLYGVGLMATKATVENGGDEAVLQSGYFTWMPYGVFVVFGTMWWLRWKGVFDFAEEGVGWNYWNCLGNKLSDFSRFIYVQIPERITSRYVNGYVQHNCEKAFEVCLLVLSPVIIPVWFILAYLLEIFLCIKFERYHRSSADYKIGRITKNVKNPCNWSSVCSSVCLCCAKKQAKKAMNSSVVKVDVKTPKRRRKSHLLESGKIKFSKLQEQVEEV